MTDSLPIRREDARVQRSRQALRAALLDLVEHRPFEAITIREITDCAGVGHATFYRHYPTKGALLDDVAAGQIRDLMALSLPVFQARSTIDVCLATVRHVEAHRRLWSALLTGGAASAVRAEIIQTAREYGGEHHPTAEWIPTDLVQRFAATALMEVLTWWLERGDTVNSEDAAKLLNQLMFFPIINPAS